MRYFLELAYNGSNYCGWQSQPNAPSVQQTLEEALSTILRDKIEVTGCGRTDTGVHAKHYVAHIETEAQLPEGFVPRLNKFLPVDIVIYKIYPVSEEMHARFSATHRAYEYHLEFQKNPFQQDTAYRFPFPQRPDLDTLNRAAALLPEYDAFFPFCKSNSDAKTMFCDVRRAEWVEDKAADKYVFHIAANRFLRGMVRLTVGMCLNVALERVTLAEVEDCLQKQNRLRRDWSVAAHGLYLTEVRYPEV